MRRLVGYVTAAVFLVVVTYGSHFYLTRSVPPASAQSAAPDEHGHAEEEHGEGEARTVKIPSQRVATANIEIETVGPAAIRDSLQLSGIVQPNQERIVQVTPRFPGVVRSLRKRIGEQVQSGETLATIESNQSLTPYDLKASSAGTVTERNAALGEFVSEQRPVFIVSDLSTIWVDFSVFRRDFKRVKVGDRVSIDPGDGDGPIDAEISYVSPFGLADSQSGLARALVPNESLRLRAGLFVTGKLLLSERKADLAVKTSAIQTLENRPVVFVQDGDEFAARDVELGDRDGEYVELLFGLMEGERYAAKNSFIVKAEMAKGSASHEH